MTASPARVTRFGLPERLLCGVVRTRTIYWFSRPDHQAAYGVCFSCRAPPTNLCTCARRLSCHQVRRHGRIRRLFGSKYGAPPLTLAQLTGRDAHFRVDFGTLVLAHRTHTLCEARSSAKMRFGVPHLDVGWLCLWAVMCMLIC